MKKLKLLWVFLWLQTVWRASIADQPALTAENFRELTFEQKLNRQLPLDLPLRDEWDRTTTLKECVAGKPAILMLGYYECPMLCNLVLNGVVESLQEIKSSADPGEQVLFVSIDPRETAELARSKRANYLKRLGRPGQESRWHFLRGDESAVRKLAEEAGFHYRYDAAHKQFAHPSGLVILTPDGRVSRYFFGVSYPAAELKEALNDASFRRPGSRIQALVILCSRFVPLTGKFSGLVMGAVRVVAVSTVLFVAVIAFLSHRKGGRKIPSEGCGS